MGYSSWLTARVLLYASSHRQDYTYHTFCYISHGALAKLINSSMGPPWRIDPTTHRTMNGRSYHRATSRSYSARVHDRSETSVKRLQSAPSTSVKPLPSAEVRRSPPHSRPTFWVWPGWGRSGPSSADSTGRTRGCWHQFSETQRYTSTLQPNTATTQHSYNPTQLQPNTATTQHSYNPTQLQPNTATTQHSYNPTQLQPNTAIQF